VNGTKIFKAIDTNGSELINFKEIIYWYTPIGNSPVDQIDSILYSAIVAWAPSLTISCLMNLDQFLNHLGNDVGEWECLSTAGSRSQLVHLARDVPLSSIVPDVMRPITINFQSPPTSTKAAVAVPTGHTGTTTSSPAATSSAEKKPRTATQILLGDLEPHQTEYLRTIFKTMDANNDGNITSEDRKRWLR
jgi:hypothetical protein